VLVSRALAPALLRTWHRWHGSRGRRRDEAGAVAVVVAAFSVAMFAFAAIVVDLGQVRDLRVRMQTAADAAALAATNSIYANGTPVPDLTSAVTAAKAYAADNVGVTAAEWASCTDPAPPTGYVASSSTPCISFRYPTATPTKPDVVRVVLPPRSVTSAFSGALGKTPPSTRAIAEAAVRVDGKVPCALCVLGTGSHYIQNGDIVVHGGDVYFNGDVNLGPNGITAADGKITVQGSRSGGHFTPTPLTGPLMTDPLAKHPLPQPPTYGGLSTTVKSNPCLAWPAGGPGIYGSWSLSGSTSCDLQSGLYVIAGDAATTWSISGQATLTGTGVTLLFTCGTATPGTTSQARNCTNTNGLGETGASLGGSGGSSVRLSAPTSGELWGYTIVYDRNNTSSFTAVGSNTSVIVGTVYAPRATAKMTGNGCISSYSVLMVVGDIAPSGDSACLNTTYDASKAAQSPADTLRLTK